MGKPILAGLSAAARRQAISSYDTTKWLPAKFSGSWVDSSPPVEFMRAQGRVFVRGVAASGTGEVFVLPKKFRPPVTLSLSVGSQVFTVAASGAVTLATGSSPAYLNFDFSTKG